MSTQPEEENPQVAAVSSTPWSLHCREDSGTELPPPSLHSSREVPPPLYASSASPICIFPSFPITASTSKPSTTFPAQSIPLRLPTALRISSTLKFPAQHFRSLQLGPWGSTSPAQDKFSLLGWDEWLKRSMPAHHGSAMQGSCGPCLKGTGKDVIGSRPSELGVQRQGEGESCHSASLPPSHLSRGIFAIFGPQCLAPLSPPSCPASPLPAERQSYQGLCIHLQLGGTVGAGSFSFGPL